MAVAARSMKRALEVKLSEHGVTSSQYVVLEILWHHNGLSLTDLGKILYFDNPTITGIINRMSRAKLVRRRRDRHDRRVIKVFLEQKGRELYSSLPLLASEVNMHAVEGFSRDEKKAVLELAKRVHFNVMNSE